LGKPPIKNILSRMGFEKKEITKLLKDDYRNYINVCKPYPTLNAWNYLKIIVMRYGL
jgi:hypothetical protein